MAVTSQAVFQAVADFARLDAAINRTESHLRRLKSTGEVAGQGIDRSIQNVAAASARVAPAQDRAAASAGRLSRSNRDLSNSNNSLSRSFDRTAVSGEKQRSFLGNLINTLGRARLAAAGFATVIGTVLVGALFKGFQRYSTIEDSTRALGIAMGSTTKAADLMAQVLDVVRGTPFNLDQFALAAKNLVVFGVEAEKVPGILTAIGEAAAASGAGSAAVQTIVDALGEAATIGRFTGDTLLRLAAQGVPALQILGNTFGKTTEEVRDMVSNGLLPAEEGMEALRKGIIEGTDGINGATVAFGGSMAGLRTTLSGVLGGMGAAVARFGASIIDVFAGPLKSGIISTTDFLDRAGKRVGEVLRAAGEQYMPIIIDFFKAAVPLAKGFFEAFAGAGIGVTLAVLQALAAVLIVLTSVLEAIPEPALRFIGAVVGLTVAWKALQAVMKIGFLQNIAERVLNLGDLLNVMRTRTLAAASSQGILRAATSTASVSLGHLVSSVNLYVLGITALIAGIFLLVSSTKKQAEQDERNAESARILAESLGLEYGAIKRVGEAAAEASPNVVDFFAANKPTIELLQQLDKAGQEAKLFQIGFDLVQRGVSPEEAIKSVKELAAQSGLDIKINFDATDLVEGKQQVESLGTVIDGIFREIEGESSADLVLGAGKSRPERIRAELAALSQSVADLVASGNFTNAAAAMQDLVASTEGLPTEEKAEARILFFNQLAKDLELVGFKMADVKAAINSGGSGLEEFIRQVTSAAVVGPGPLEEWAAAVQIAADALGGDYDAAVAKVNEEQPKLAQAVAQTTEELNAAAGAADGLAVKLEQTEEQAKALEEATKATTSALATFTDVGSVYGDVLAAQQDEERERAEGVADSVNEAARARSDAAKKSTASELERMREANDAEVKRLRGTKQYTDEYISEIERANEAEEKAFSASRETADEGKASWEDFANQVTLDLGRLAEEFEKQLENTRAFSDNLTAIYAQYGTNVGDKVRDSGAGAADLAAALAEGGDEADRVARILDEISRFDATAGDITKRQQLLGSLPATTEGFETQKPNLDEVAGRLGMSRGDAIAIISEFGTTAQREWAVQQGVLFTNAGGTGKQISDSIRQGLIDGIPQFVAAVQMYADALRENLNPVIVELNGQLYVQTDTTRAGTADGGAQYGGAAQGGGAATGGVDPIRMRELARRIGEPIRRAQGGFLPSTATIEPGRGRGLIQWAEDSTKGESFIPLDTTDPNKLRRSLSIWETTGEKLGALPSSLSGLMSPQMFSRGGFIATSSQLSVPSAKRFADGGFAQSMPSRPNQQTVPISADTHYELPNATIVANDPKELWSAIEDEARLKALSGS